MLGKQRRPKVTEAAVLEALRPVQDPELHRSIVDLDMVRTIVVDGGLVAVQVALTVAGCPLRAEITKRVTDAVQALEGVERVDVDLTVMTPEELDALRRKVQGGGGGGGAGHDHAGHDHAGHGHDNPAERVIPFMEPGNRTRVLGIASGKGGVGKSSVTVNLAVTLARLGHSVAVLDADVYGFSVPRMLGVAQPPTILSDEMILPPESHGVKCISMGFFVEEENAVIWRGPMLHKALHQFLTDFYWDDPDFLLIDMPPGTGDIALSMAQYLPKSEVYIVTTPQAAAQRVAQRTAAFAKKVNLPVRGVIENMSWFTGDDGKRYDLFGSGGGQLLAEEIEVPFLGQVPLVQALRSGGDSGVPLSVTEPEGEVGQAFLAIAERIVALGAPRVYRPELKIS